MIISGIIGLGINELRKSLNKVQGDEKRMLDRANRIDNAKIQLEKDKSDYNNTKNKMKGSAANYTNWKGQTRQQFDKFLDVLLQDMNSRYSELDDYCDDLNTAASRAKTAAGKTAPIIQELKTMIENWTN